MFLFKDVLRCFYSNSFVRMASLLGIPNTAAVKVDELPYGALPEHLDCRVGSFFNSNTTGLF